MEANNIQKLREALIEARHFVFAAMQGQRDLLVNNKVDEPYVLKPKDTLSKIDAALAAPLRKCDRFNSGDPVKDAQDAWDAMGPKDSYISEMEMDFLTALTWLFRKA